MKLSETKLSGAFVLTQERHNDERGFFARLWAQEQLASWGLKSHLEHVSISHNARRGTLRGLHSQADPHPETKLVACTRGALFDVLLDLRKSSATYLEWVGVELSADNGRMVYIPEGVAHGFLTLADDSDVLYHMTGEYHPELSRGARWDDPAYGVAWPFSPVIMSDRDRDFVDFRFEEAP